MEIFRLIPPDAVERDHIAFSRKVDTARREENASN
jgi:hypothetical protein